MVAFLFGPCWILMPVARWSVVTASPSSHGGCDQNLCPSALCHNGKQTQSSVWPLTVPLCVTNDQSWHCGSHTRSQCVQLPFFFLHTEVTLLYLLKHQLLFLYDNLAQLTHTLLYHHFALWLAAGLVMSDLTLHPNFSAAISLNGNKDNILLPCFPTGMWGVQFCSFSVFGQHRSVQNKQLHFPPSAAEISAQVFQSSQYLTGTE